VLARDTITNYCLPTRSLRLEVEVGASYDVAPNVVKSVIREALKSARDISHDRPPEVLLGAFGASAMTYRVRFWVGAFDPDDRVEDTVRSLIYYALKRNNITIPYPIQVEMSADEGGVAPVRVAAEANALAPVTLFSTLTDDERAGLVAIARRVVYAAGEAVVRQGDAGGSLFVVVGGEAAVTLASAGGEVARLGAGDVFGEMSLLTGEARTATVTAIRDCDLLEIDAEGFRRAVLANPSVLERITAVAATRREEMERHQEAHAMPAPAAEIRQSLLHRVRQFLRL
jgi:CRP-like cAMP-binding protein